MSAPPLTVPTDVTGATQAAQARPARADRRWLRMIVPVAIAFLIIGSTLMVHAIQQPSTKDPAYLSPGSTAGIGSAALVSQLTAAGLPVTVDHTGADALSRVSGGGFTLVIAAPGLLRPDLLLKLPELPADVTVLLIRPSQFNVLELGLPVAIRTRWATRASHGCAGLPPGTRAATYRDRYATPDLLADSDVRPTRDCFEHSVQAWRQPGHGEIVLVGADDIFRNDRIGELDNARVAASLFPAGRPVVWLDLHKQEKLPHAQSTKPPKKKQPPRAGLPFPAWVKASAAGLALAGVLGAMAAARRLGPPVPEPLPVAVRGTETALGRGRLYRRARARGAALQALRDEAGTRLRVALAVPPDAPPDALVAAVAAHTGTAPELVRQALYGPEPEDDEQLRAAVDALDQLVNSVHPYQKEWS
jgi:hypothetical protein